LIENMLRSVQNTVEEIRFHSINKTPCITKTTLCLGKKRTDYEAV